MSDNQNQQLVQQQNNQNQLPAYNPRYSTNADQDENIDELLPNNVQEQTPQNNEQQEEKQQEINDEVPTTIQEPEENQNNINENNKQKQQNEQSNQNQQEKVNEDNEDKKQDDKVQENENENNNYQNVAVEYKPRKQSQDVEEIVQKVEQIATQQLPAPPQQEAFVYKPRKASQQSIAISTTAKIVEQNSTQTKQKTIDYNNPLFRPRIVQPQIKPTSTYQSQQPSVNDTDKLLSNYNPEKFDQYAQQKSEGPKYSVTMAPQFPMQTEEQGFSEKKSCQCLLY